MFQDLLTLLLDFLPWMDETGPTRRNPSRIPLISRKLSETPGELPTWETVVRSSDGSVAAGGRLCTIPNGRRSGSAFPCSASGVEGFG